MALFRPYERTSPSEAGSARDQLKPRQGSSSVKSRTAPEKSKDVAAEEPTPAPTKVTRGPVRKTTATPTRKQAEAERMRRLHPDLSPKEQRRQRREARQQAWDRVEQSPERRLVRDYVDSRWTLIEFTLPVMMIVMIAALVTIQYPVISLYLSLSLWVLMLAIVVNLFILWRGVKRLLIERYPRSSRRGLMVYLFNRALMVRRFRQPPPQVERGAEV